MGIELLDNNNTEIATKSYIQEAIGFFDEDVSTKVSSPVNKNMHKGNKDSPTIPNNNAEYFHSIVAKLLWTTKRAQPYNENSLLFLCTQVKSPTGQDKKKLKILLNFINRTMDDRRLIDAYSLSDLLTWIDAE